MLRYNFDPETNVFGFYGLFWYHNNSVMNREETRGALVYMGPRFGPFCVLFWKMNNMI